MGHGTDADYLAYVHGRVTRLRRTAYLLCGDEHQADDLVQETITKLYARWSRISGLENIDGYVHTMLVRAFLDEQRRGWWRVRLGVPPDRPAPAPPGHGVDERTMLRAALARVPARQQAVLVLRFLCDQPVADVARVLGCSEGTVKSQTAHGLTALRRILGDRIHSLGGAR
ncbi:SigE family RNA polymerase sigma factor [Actinoplanes sp. NPDC049599]|uniref:SigE family RNA polymerase sigma factor n=1 Tax=Actinoplanes sp. NPDC049599 TaxID=3363903 RepID=UPI0037B78FE1